MDFIVVVCPQGHKLKARAAQAGKQFACPACGAKVLVKPPASAGAPAAVPASPADPLGLSDLDLGSSDPFAAANSPTGLGGPAPTGGFPGAGAMYSGAPLYSTPASTGPAPGRASQKGSTKFWWIVGGAVAGGGLLLVVVAVVVVMLVMSNAGDGPAPVASNMQTMPPGVGAPPGLPPGSPPGAPAPGTAPVLAPAPAPVAGGRDDAKKIRDNLYTIAQAVNEFHSVRKTFAPPVVAKLTDSTVSQGGTQLSWRVHLLPYVKEAELYQEFHLNESWDSPHNRTLLARMPNVYRLRATETETTRVQMFTGPGGLLQPEKAIGLRDVGDGAFNTLLLVVVGPDRAIPWTKPDDLAVDKADPWRPLGTLSDDLLHCALVDTTVITFPRSITGSQLLAMIDPNDGQNVKPLDLMYRPR